MSAAVASVTAKKPRTLSPAAKRGIRIGVVVLVVLAMVLGTRIVSNDNPIVAGEQEFDPATFAQDNFEGIQEAVAERAVDADVLAGAIAADPAAAADEYAAASSGGPVFSVTFTGVAGDGQSGIYPITVEGLPSDILVRVQTGPAINGTELRDATGEVTFGQFTNQIEYQNAAAALNDQLKEQVLADIDTAGLSGRTVTVTGAFTLINPEAWLVTPVEMSVE